MSAVLCPSFGDPVAIRNAEVGNATFERAVKLGYGRFTAQALARQAKRVALDCETPAQVALRVVHPRHASATRPMRPGGGSAA